MNTKNYFELLKSACKGYDVPRYSALEKELLTLIQRCYEGNESAVFAKHFIKQVLEYHFSDSSFYDLSDFKPLGLQGSAHLSSFSAQEGADTLALERLACLKLNGGLGTSMGCLNPKCFIEVSDGLNFLDKVKRQHASLNNSSGCDVPLFFMNSFYTDAAMKATSESPKHMICQHQSPRLIAGTLNTFQSPVTEREWAPPGHGDLYMTLYDSGLLESLLAQGKDILFVSNIDNIYASYDSRLLRHFLENKLEFMMEVTQRRMQDKKGGAIAAKHGQNYLIERAQLHEKDWPAFEDVSAFQLFNTNNLWLNLRAVKAAIEADTLQLPLIRNKKLVDDKPVVQLETAMGAAIQCFEKSDCVVVDRNRFFPVKTTSDLLLLRAYEQGKLANNSSMPAITLDEAYATVEGFNKLFECTPDLTALNSLQIKGKVTVGPNVNLVGDVRIENNSDTALYISNQTISG